MLFFLFIYLFSFFDCCFCRLWEKPDVACVICSARRENQWVSSSSSSSPLVVVLYPDSPCFIQSGGDWDGGRFYGTSLKRLSKWGENNRSVVDAYGGRAGLTWKTHWLTFSSVVDRSSIQSEMGMLGCGIFVLALFFKCHSHSLQNPMDRFKRWGNSFPLNQHETKVQS